MDIFLHQNDNDTAAIELWTLFDNGSTMELSTVIHEGFLFDHEEIREKLRDHSMVQVKMQIEDILEPKYNNNEDEKSPISADRGLLARCLTIIQALEPESGVLDFEDIPEELRSLYKRIFRLEALVKDLPLAVREDRLHRYNVLEVFLQNEAAKDGIFQRSVPNDL